jgi:hypothetical protein
MSGFQMAVSTYLVACTLIPKLSYKEHIAASLRQRLLSIYNQNPNSCHHIFDFYASSHSCHWLTMRPLYFHSYNAYCCLVETDSFLKGHMPKNNSKTALHLITTMVS